VLDSQRARPAFAKLAQRHGALLGEAILARTLGGKVVPAEALRVTAGIPAPEERIAAAEESPLGAADLESLEATIKETPPKAGERAWLQALAEVGSESAARLFLRLVFDESSSHLVLFGMDSGNRRQKLLKRHPPVVAELLERLRRPHPETARSIVGPSSPSAGRPVVVHLSPGSGALSGSRFLLVRSDARR